MSEDCSGPGLHDLRRSDVGAMLLHNRGDPRRAYVRLSVRSTWVGNGPAAASPTLGLPDNVISLREPTTEQEESQRRDLPWTGR